MASNQKIKDFKKLLKKTQLELFRCQGRLAIANKTVHDLMEHSDMQERHTRMIENDREKKLVIIDYLEDRQVKLIQAMAE